MSWDYGTDTTYGSSVSYGSALAPGTVDSQLDGYITGLSPSTTYHYRAVISSAQGTAYGAST